MTTNKDLDEHKKVKLHGEIYAKLTVLMFQSREAGYVVFILQTMITEDHRKKTMLIKNYKNNLSYCTFLDYVTK